jgi:hypothetical protein
MPIALSSPMDAILDFTRELDISLFDRVVSTLFSGYGVDVYILIIPILFSYTLLSKSLLRLLSLSSKNILTHGLVSIQSWHKPLLSSQKYYQIILLILMVLVYRIASTGKTHSDQMENFASRTVSWHSRLYCRHNYQDCK